MMKERYLLDYEKPLSPLGVIEEASRCLLCYDAPCSKECPAHTEPDKFIRAVRFHNFDGAAEIVRENNVLGGICARVCPSEKLCQKGCLRAGLDKPINIPLIQRFITDFEEDTKMDILAKGKDNGKKVAFIGSGPSALEASYVLINKGYKVKIYEKENVLGGALRLIPPYRLNDQVIDQEINKIIKLGLEYELNVEVGKDIPLNELLDEFDAVILDAGLSYGKSLTMFDNYNNVELAIDFLRRVKKEKGSIPLDDNYLVIGGGDVAMDVVTTLKMLGVQYVNDVVYETFDEFKASEKELTNARSEKVSIIDGYVPVAYDGKVVTFKHRFLENELKIKANKIILAIGQCAKLDGFDVAIEKGEVASKMYHIRDNFFVSGDLAPSKQSKTVVGAVRVGKEVAYYVDAYLGGK